jgi:hypothetical protein
MHAIFSSCQSLIARRRGWQLHRSAAKRRLLSVSRSATMSACTSRQSGATPSKTQADSAFNQIGITIVVRGDAIPGHASQPVLAEPITCRYREKPRDARVAGPVLRQVVVLCDRDVGVDAGRQCQTVIKEGALGPQLRRGAIPARLNKAALMKLRSAHVEVLPQAPPVFQAFGDSRLRAIDVQDRLADHLSDFVFCDVRSARDRPRSWGRARRSHRVRTLRRTAGRSCHDRQTPGRGSVASGQSSGGQSTRARTLHNATQPWVFE